MIVMKAKESPGKFICLSFMKANAKINPQIFICNRFCVDGIVLRTLHTKKVLKQLPASLVNSEGAYSQSFFAYPYPDVSEFAEQNSGHGLRETQTKTQTTPDSAFS